MIIIDAALLFFLEIIEANLTKNRNFEEIVQWYGQLIRNNKLYFAAIHSSLIYLIYTVYSHKLSGFIIFVAVTMKVLDLATKVYLGTKTDENGQFSMMENFNIPNMEISPALRYSGALIYPIAVLIAAY